MRAAIFLFINAYLSKLRYQSEIKCGSQKQFHWLLTVCIEQEFLWMEICAKYLNYHLTISIKCENFYLLDQDKKCLITQSIKPLKSFINDSGFFCTWFLIIVYFKKKIFNKSCVAWRFEGMFFTQIPKHMKSQTIV